MTLATFSTSIEAQQAAVLLDGYRFELGNHDARQWIALWLEFYRPTWIRDAVVEALYQGRYKSRSVIQILELWERRGQPVRHASHEFEAAICREFGEVKLVTTLPRSTSASIQTSQEDPIKERASHRIHQSLSSMASNSLAHSDKEVAPAEATTDEESNRLPLSDPQSTFDQAVTDDLLRSHNQKNGILFSSARAIQPFKPTLPFSAQTLQLAKKKALATIQ